MPIGIGTKHTCNDPDCKTVFISEVKRKHYRGYVETYVICPKCGKVVYLHSKKTHHGIYDENNEWNNPLYPE